MILGRGLGIEVGVCGITCVLFLVGVLGGLGFCIWAGRVGYVGLVVVFGWDEVTSLLGVVLVFPCSFCI